MGTTNMEEVANIYLVQIFHLINRRCNSHSKHRTFIFGIFFCKQLKFNKLFLHLYNLSNCTWHSTYGGIRGRKSRRKRKWGSVGRKRIKKKMKTIRNKRYNSENFLLSLYWLYILVVYRYINYQFITKGLMCHQCGNTFY